MAAHYERSFWLLCSNIMGTTIINSSTVATAEASG